MPCSAAATRSTARPTRAPTTLMRSNGLRCDIARRNARSRGLSDARDASGTFVVGARHRLDEPHGGGDGHDVAGADEVVGDHEEAEADVDAGRSADEPPNRARAARMAGSSAMNSPQTTSAASHEPRVRRSVAPCDGAWAANVTRALPAAGSDSSEPGSRSRLGSPGERGPAVGRAVVVRRFPRRPSRQSWCADGCSTRWRPASTCPSP